MRQRALIHVGGPAGAGKTTFIEAMLEGNDGFILAARCLRDDALSRAGEASPKKHPELQRYRDAGASGMALFRFPANDGNETFFETDLMADYSQAVVLEGDNPIEFVDLDVFVAPLLPPGKTLLVRRKRNRAREERAKVDGLARLLRQPDGVEKFQGEMAGAPLAAFARQHPELLERTRGDLLAGLAHLRHASPPAPTDHWAISVGYEGIERTQLVVINVRHDRERERGEALAAELARLRNDPAVFDDILGVRGSKIPITVVVANLLDAKDAGRKKALARVRRALRAAN